MTKNIYTILTILIIGAIVIAGVATFYTVFESGFDQPALDNSPVTYTQDTTKRPRTKRKDQYQIITRSGLFGTTEEEQEEIVDDIDLDTLEQTSLNVTLIGTIPIEGDPENSVAIISIKSKKPPVASYKVGDSVEGAIIKSIRRKMVVLNVKGKDEILLMDDATTETVGRRSPSAAAPPTAQSDGRPDRTVNLKKQELEESIANLPEMMKTIKINTHIKDGEPDGVQISGVKSGTIFRKLGLINGDIIQSIDGKDIRSIEDLASMYDDLQSSKNVSIRFERRGRQRTYEYKIQ